MTAECALSNVSTPGRFHADKMGPPLPRIATEFAPDVIYLRLERDRSAMSPLALA